MNTACRRRSKSAIRPVRTTARRPARSTSRSSAPNRIGRVHGAKDNSYTAGVICAKVARYAERVHHPDRLLKPLVRSGAKGEGAWKEATWEAALDLVADRLIKAEEKYGSETVWPYFYAGTMGLVQRDGIERLRHAKKYSGLFDSFCTNLAWTGFIMGTGRLRGADPREMAKSDCVVIWGTNAVVTQVNVMTHAVRARKERGAKIVVVDVYENATMKQADMGLVLKPGTDGALACAVMHVLFRDGLADRDYLEKYTDDPAGLEAHLKSRTPEWAAAITGVSVAEIEAFARLVGTTKRTFFRLGYGFARQRNGAVNMHAALSIAAVTGAWQYEGGGAFHSNSDILKLDKSTIEGSRFADPRIRHLDQSKIGRGADRRSRGALRRPAGDGDARPEHQPRQCRAGAAAGEARLAARGPVHLRARAVHDRHGAGSPTSCCRPPCSSSTTTSIAAAATSTSSWGRS